MTEEVIAALSDAVSHGLSNRDAAAIAGIAESTLYLWLEDPDNVELLRSAKAKRKLVRVKALENADPGHWQKYAWLLERSDLAFCSLPDRLKFMLAEKEQAQKKPDDLDAEMRKMLG